MHHQCLGSLKSKGIRVSPTQICKICLTNEHFFHAVLKYHNENLFFLSLHCVFSSYVHQSTVLLCLDWSNLSTMNIWLWSVQLEQQCRPPVCLGRKRPVTILATETCPHLKCHQAPSTSSHFNAIALASHAVDTLLHTLCENINTIKVAFSAEI